LSATPLASLRVLVKTIVLGVVILTLAPIQVVVVALTRRRAAMWLPMLFHRLICVVLGLQVEVRGAPQRASRTVFISNHLSHLDIPVIGSVLRACFVAKDDIRGWLVFGALARLQQTVFISRNPRRAGEIALMLSAALDAGRCLVLFPEGTTSDGSTVLPFKSSIFAMLVDPSLPDMVLQPMTIELLEVDGRAIIDGGDRDLYAYHGDMQMGPHLFAFMRLSGARVRLTFHAILPQQETRSRKTLAALAHASVSQSASMQAAA
jgi:1-acyl-sn-glycerol-3-phosphate acyltransferase